MSIEYEWPSTFSIRFHFLIMHWLTKSITLMFSVFTIQYLGLCVFIQSVCVCARALVHVYRCMYLVAHKVSLWCLSADYFNLHARWYCNSQNNSCSNWNKKMVVFTQGHLLTLKRVFYINMNQWTLAHTFGSI